MPLTDVTAALSRAAAAVAGTDGIAPPQLTRADPRFGDYATNAAMSLAGRLRRPPREVAEALREAIGRDAAMAEALESVEVAGPGFLNLRMSGQWYGRLLDRLLADGPRFGAGAPRPGKLHLEFVSANPTGPIHAAGGRWGAYGDSLRRLLSFAGHDVHAEYYVNDHGTQIRKFGESLAARYAGREPPEDGYQGAYLGDLARQLPEGLDEHDVDLFTHVGLEHMLAAIQHTMVRFRVGFDRYFSESSLYETGRVGEALARLRDQGAVYEQDEALWLRTTAYGDDKDRVLVRASGEPTYFASDVGYHADKIGRGFTHQINVLGADHHGYVARMKAAYQALGRPADELEIVIGQFVNLIESGERRSMSKRRGDLVTLDELIDTIGVDAARWFMVARSQDSPFDLDIDAARERSNDNPVFYVQYAHARIASIRAKAAAEGADAESTAPAGVVDHPAERALLRHLAAFPETVAEAAERRAPHKVTTYATDTAAAFHAFYRDCRVVDAADPKTTRRRLQLCHAAATVLATALDLVGVAAPERM